MLMLSKKASIYAWPIVCCCFTCHIKARSKSIDKGYEWSTMRYFLFLNMYVEKHDTTLFCLFFLILESWCNIHGDVLPGVMVYILGA
jgi:hypothetical protein